VSPTAAKTKAEQTAACCLVSRPVLNPDGTQAALCLVAPPGHTRHGSFAAGFITSILPQASCEQYRDGRGASAKLAWRSRQRVSEGSLRADLRHRGRPGGLSTSLRQSSVASFTGFTNSNAQARQRCGYARPIAPRVCQSTQRCGRHRGPPVPGCPLVGPREAGFCRAIARGEAASSGRAPCDCSWRCVLKRNVTGHPRASLL